MFEILRDDREEVEKAKPELSVVMLHVYMK